jgi:hypothetical protein
MFNYSCEYESGSIYITRVESQEGKNRKFGHATYILEIDLCIFDNFRLLSIHLIMIIQLTPYRAFQ